LPHHAWQFLGHDALFAAATVHGENDRQAEPGTIHSR